MYSCAQQIYSQQFISKIGGKSFHNKTVLCLHDNDRIYSDT